METATRRLTVYLEPDLISALKHAAIEERMSVSDLVRSALFNQPQFKKVARKLRNVEARGEG